MAKKTAKKAQEIWNELESKLETLNQDIFPEIEQYKEEIEQYRSELLIDSENHESIKTKIKEKEDEIEESSIKAKDLTQEIIDLYSKVFEGEDGENSIKEEFEGLLTESGKLFADTENKKEDFDLFYKKIFGEKDEHGKIQGGLDEKLKQVQKDIDTRKKDIDILLERVTSGSLLDGFLKSKKEYKQIPEYNSTEKNKILRFLINSFIWTTNKISILFEYILFILPLVMSVVIFVQPTLVESVLGGNGGTISELLKGLNFMEKLIISLPLWWISWFGQRSIGQKRRLAEEYNHKARVTEMYLNFSSRETSDAYPITDDAKEKLDKLLIKAIGRNPVEVYGKDETLLDKIVKLKFGLTKDSDEVEEEKKDEKN